jgi:hypothetical protein
MKALTTAPNSADRISTPEELQLVVGVLIDLNRAEDVEMVHFGEPTEGSAPEMTDSWLDLYAGEESTPATESAELVSLFAHSRERTN